jgi:hypothetical protein
VAETTVKSFMNCDLVARRLHRMVGAALSQLGIHAALYTIQRREEGQLWLKIEYALCSGWYRGEYLLPAGLAQTESASDCVSVVGWLGANLPALPPAGD